MSVFITINGFEKDVGRHLQQIVGSHSLLSHRN